MRSDPPVFYVEMPGRPELYVRDNLVDALQACRKHVGSYVTRLNVDGSRTKMCQPMQRPQGTRAIT